MKSAKKYVQKVAHGAMVGRLSVAQNMYQDALDRCGMLSAENAALRKQLEWVSLTDDEIKAIVGRINPGEITVYTLEMFKKIEDKLREKDEANKALRIAVGLLSTYPKLSSQHPEYTFEHILKMARECSK